MTFEIVFIVSMSIKLSQIELYLRKKMKYGVKW